LRIDRGCQCAHDNEDEECYVGHRHSSRECAQRLYVIEEGCSAAGDVPGIIAGGRDLGRRPKKKWPPFANEAASEKKPGKRKASQRSLCSAAWAGVVVGISGLGVRRAGGLCSQTKYSSFGRHISRRVSESQGKRPGRNVMPTLVPSSGVVAGGGGFGK